MPASNGGCKHRNYGRPSLQTTPQQTDGEWGCPRRPSNLAGVSSSRRSVLLAYTPDDPTAALSLCPTSCRPHCMLRFPSRVYSSVRRTYNRSHIRRPTSRADMPHLTMLSAQLALAEKRIETCERIIARQQTIIRGLLADRHNIVDAEGLLRDLYACLITHLSHRDHLREELARARPAEN